MYASTLDSVRSGICNVGPRRIGDPRRGDGDYVESGVPESPDSRTEKRFVHSYST